MTEEELNRLLNDCEYFLNGKGEVNLHNFVENLRTTYIEPKEKQIAELKDEVHTWKEASSTNSYKAFHAQEEIKTLSKHILELQNDKGELTDRCKELEAQIGKMKCCENCAWWYKLPNGQRDCAETCENLDNWSLRR